MNECKIASLINKNNNNAWKMRIYPTNLDTIALNIDISSDFKLD